VPTGCIRAVGGCIESSALSVTSSGYFRTRQCKRRKGAYTPMGNHVPFRILGGSALLAGAIVVTLLIGRSSALASATSAPVPAPKNQQAYCETYVNTLAKALGVSMAKLADANRTALQAALQQASSDGTISQAQKTKILNSFTGTDPCADIAHMAAAQHAQMSNSHQAVVAATASALKLTPSALENDLNAGKTIPQIASAQHVNLSDVNTAYLNAVQTQLNTAVTNGDLTQDQANKIFSSVQQAVAQGKYPMLRAHGWSGQK
jgi:DnaJ-domain-containing protein 1